MSLILTALEELGHVRYSDYRELQRSHRRLRSNMSRSRRQKDKVDQAQDARIASLELENDELTACVAGLLAMLASKGILSDEEWLRISELMQADLDLQPVDEDEGESG